MRSEIRDPFVNTEEVMNDGGCGGQRNPFLSAWSGKVRRGVNTYFVDGNSNYL